MSRAENFNLTLDAVVSPGVPGPGAGNIDSPNATDVYTFNGTNGQVLFLEELSVAPAFGGWLYWELKSPTATVLSGYLQGQHEGRAALTVTGTHTLTVRVLAPAPSRVGDYSFRVRSVTADQVFPITIGDTVSKNVPGPGAGNIDLPGASDVYEFSAPAGKLVFFDRISAAAAFNGWLLWEVRSPSGQLLIRTYFGSGNDGRKELPETGVYKIRLIDGTDEISHIGDYSFRLGDIPADQTFPLEFGNWITNGAPGPGAGNIEVAGAYDFYTFQATAGQNLFFEDLPPAASFGGWLRWELRSPSNDLIFGDWMGGQPAGRFTMPQTGTYKLRCFAASTETSHTGTYSFRVQNLDDSAISLPIGQLVTNGVPVAGAGNIEQAGSQDLYSFNATAGQRIVFHEIAAAAAFGGWLKLELTSPSNAKVFSEVLQPGRIRSWIMPETGTYKLKAFASVANNSYVGTYSFRAYCEVFAGADKTELKPNTPVALPISRILCNDRWEAGDSVTVSLPEATSAQGGTVVTNATAIVYSPPAGFTGTDSFVYKITGIYGDDDTNVVRLAVGPAASQNMGVVMNIVQSPGLATVCLTGTPNQSYDVEQSLNLRDWSPTGTKLTADSDGGMSFSYPVTESHKFFRFPMAQ